MSLTDLSSGVKQLGGKTGLFRTFEQGPPTLTFSPVDGSSRDVSAEPIAITTTPSILGGTFSAGSTTGPTGGTFTLAGDFATSGDFSFSGATSNGTAEIEITYDAGPSGTVMVNYSLEITGIVTTGEFTHVIEQQFSTNLTDATAYHWVDQIANSQDGYWQFTVPSNFATLVDAYIWVMGDGSVTGDVDIDLESKYGKNAEQMDLTTETDTVTKNIAAVSKRLRIDVSSVLTGIEGGDNVGLKFSNVDAGGLKGIAGILEYNS